MPKLNLWYISKVAREAGSWRGLSGGMGGQARTVFGKSKGDPQRAEAPLNKGRIAGTMTVEIAAILVAIAAALFSLYGIHVAEKARRDVRAMNRQDLRIQARTLNGKLQDGSFETSRQIDEIKDYIDCVFEFAGGTESVARKDAEQYWYERDKQLTDAFTELDDTDETYFSISTPKLESKVVALRRVEQKFEEVRQLHSHWREEADKTRTRTENENKGYY